MAPVNTGPSIPPTYNPQRFLGRQDEINAVTAAIDALYRGDNERKRVILFRGERGSGKSWLALHLQRSVLPQLSDKATSFLLLLDRVLGGGDLQENEWSLREAQGDQISISANSEQQVDELTKKLLAWIADRLGAARVLAHTKPTLSELTAWLPRDIEDKFQKRVLVLILDSVFEANPEFVQSLEQHLLAGLVNNPKVLLVMTGRGKPHEWTSSRLRIDVEERTLSAFDAKTTYQQLRDVDPSLAQNAEQAHHYSGGYPLANLLFARLPPKKALIDYFGLLVDPSDADEVRLWCSALCILDAFREDVALRLLEEADVRVGFERVKSKLGDQLGWLRWERGRYVWDEAIAHPTREVLKATDRDLWVRLNCAAWRAYHEKAEADPDYSDFYNTRARRYAEHLQQVGAGTGECEGAEERVAMPA
jgi:hypothetical protein